MPPKSDASTSQGETINGFTAKETKMIAAAFVSSTGPDKYDYDLFASLTGNTAGSLKKMWPPVKRKVADAHGSFATFLGSTAPARGGAGEADAPKAKAAAKPKANGTQKRKASSAEPDDEGVVEKSDLEAETNGHDDLIEKKTPVKGRKRKADSVVVDGEGEKEKKPAAKRGRKKVKTEEAEDIAAKEGDAEVAEEEVTQEDV